MLIFFSFSETILSISKDATIFVFLGPFLHPPKTEMATHQNVKGMN